MKKNIFQTLILMVVLLNVFTGCQKEEFLYAGNDYVMFADSTAYMPVTKDANKFFDVMVATTKAADHDRNFAVELVTHKSNAIDGQHFELLSNNVTIKAGELAGKIQVKGHYDNIVYGDSLAFTLRLLAPKEQIWQIYGREMNVSIIKCPPFDINQFTGNMRFYASFPFSDRTVKFLIKSEDQNDSTLVIKGAFTDKTDLKLRLKSNSLDPFESGVIVNEQPAFTDANYGKVLLRTVDNSPSFYNMQARMIFLYLELYVPGVGSFGVYRYIFQWIPQSEADAENNGTGSPRGFNIPSISDFRVNK